MIENLVGVLAIIGLIVMLARLYTKVGLLEREVGALRSFVLALGTPAAAPVVAVAAEQPVAFEAADVVTGTAPPQQAPEAIDAAEPLAEAAMAAADGSGAQAADTAPPAAPAQPAKKRDIETALGTRWAVWVGGLALALGAVFLIRYSIEAGIFGPAVRLAMSGLLGLVLVGAGEFIRRTGFKVPVEGAAAAFVPGILTGVGAFALFGTVYAAHGLYGFIGPATAFILLGIIGVGAIGAALIHGQALAGIGLVGSMVTPALVSSQSPSAWALFGYLAIVLVANTGVARLRDWMWLAAVGFVGTGCWWLLYLSDVDVANLTVIMFITLVTLATLALVWLGPWPANVPGAAARRIDWASVGPAVFVALAAMALFVDNGFAFRGGELQGLVLLLAMLAVALWRPAAIPLLFGAGFAAIMVHVRLAATGDLTVDLPMGEVTVEGLPVPVTGAYTIWSGIGVALAFLAAGFWSALRWTPSEPRRAAAWAGWGALVPLVSVGALWVGFGNLDRDFAYAAAALVLALALIAGAEAIARREDPALKGGWAVTLALFGAGAAAVLGIHMAFAGLWTTILVGMLAIVPALATRWRSYPVLGWLCVAAVIVTMGRIGFDPTIVGEQFLSRTPVWNQLLPAYGLPALAFVFSAWQLARTTNGRPRLVMEAASALFALLTVAILVRHAMHGGILNADEPTLAEQAIYTLLALGAGAILVAIDMRSPSSVLRIGSMAAGVVSVFFIVVQHYLVLNPLFTGESTGKITFFNLLFLAYLLPAIAAGALALYARNKRPQWYSAMLGLLAATLAFVYATLSVRRLFLGEFIEEWMGMSQAENYSYSALWLAMGVGVLVIGVWLRSYVLRVASAVLIALTVAKVFLFDMRELEGVLRAFSFIGLGAVLIGIGLFYQKLLSRQPKEEEPVPAVPTS